MTWLQQEAIDLCIKLEVIAPDYRIRQVEKIDVGGLFDAFELIGVRKVSGFGWCHKATYQGKPIDFFFPEEDGEYIPEHPTIDDLPFNPEFA